MSLVVASDPKEMAESQNALIANVAAKIEVALAEAKDAHDMVAVAQTARIGLSKAKAIHKKASWRVSFLTKVKEVLEQGYFPVPDMEGDIIAVRTEKDDLDWNDTRWRDGWGPHVVQDQVAEALPSGAGRYISPRLKVQRGTRHFTRQDGKPGQERQYRGIALRDPDGIKARFVKPEILNRTGQAMARKVFDEIVCVSPVRSRRGRDADPIVLGRIIDPINKKVSAFLICWFMDTDEL